jgi:glycosyltransferase involved in cell wall biosynthesis
LPPSSVTTLDLSMTTIPTPPETAPVSVIIPAWNAESFIADCVTSVLTQLPQPAEILVVNDGSTDATATIARSFPAPVRVVSQANAGVAAARNRGIREARQPILAFLDADDVMAAGRIERHFAILRDQPHLDLVFGLQVTFVTATPPLETWTRNTATEGLIASTLTCRREVFDRVGTFSIDLRSSETIDWMSRAQGNGIRSYVDDEVAVWRRIHARNLSGAKQRSGAAYLDAVKRHLDRMRGK